MGSEYMGPLPDPDKQPPVPIQRQFAAPNSAEKRQSGTLLTNNGEDTQPRQAIQPVNQPTQPSEQREQEPSYREHVSGQLLLHPSEAPYFRPAYQPYQQQQQQKQPPSKPQQPSGQPGQAYPYPIAPQYPGIPPAYPGYQYHAGYSGYPAYPAQPGYPPNGGYPPNIAYPPLPGAYPGYSYPGYQAYGYYPPYPYYPPQPKRDGYLFGISIAAFIGSILAVLGGLTSAGFLLLTAMVSASTGRLANQQLFSGLILLTALAIAGLGGGGFSLYHSIRSLFLKKPSAQFKLPWFWLFFILYVLVIAVGFLVSANQRIAVNSPVTISLIVLSGILPALTILSLALRRVRRKGDTVWPTTWRRFTLAIVSGATSAVLLASIFEFALTLIAIAGLHVNGFSLDNPDMPIPQDPRLILFMFILVSAIAPLVEETVKPLAAVVLIGRMNSAAEAFVLGLSCGIGFDIIETLGYISQGYHQWLDTAIERSSAGLLHGFGAGMVTLGWYFLTHKNSTRGNRILLGIGCGAYAILQHAIWNGSFGLQLLPAPIGPFLDKGTIMIGSYAMPGLMVVYIAETLLMLAFFLYITGKLRGRGPTPTSASRQPKAPPAPAVRVPAHV